MALEEMASTSFSDLPEDVQLNILSFLTAAEAAVFALTSRRHASLCGPSSPLWLPVCRRRWGTHAQLLRSWAPPRIPSYRLLYRALDRWAPLSGLWRLAGRAEGPALLLFEWGPSTITAALISPSRDPRTPLAVLRTPFLFLGLSSAGDPACFLDPRSVSTDGSSDPGLVPVEVSFIGENHIVVEESKRGAWEARGGEEAEEEAAAAGSPPDRKMWEIYEYLANRTIPGGDRAARRQWRRKQLGRRRLEPKHFVKIDNAWPTPAQPLQGLWKGVSEDMKLDFYLVTYDESRGLSCRRVGEAAGLSSSYFPVFWTSSNTFLEPPFSEEEQSIYGCREHIQPVDCSSVDFGMEAISHILCINSSYDLVIPDLPGSSRDARNVEGRVWIYEDGTFGFGFLRNNFIIDLKHVTMDGRLLDSVEYFHDVSSL